ncbi:MAG: PAS domain S-box protein [Terriglobales bacterium]
MSDARTRDQQLELYRRIFESSHDAIAIIDPQGYYLRQNAAHRELLGYSDEEIVGRTPAMHLGEETFAAVTQELARAGQWHGEVISRTKSGDQRTVELSAFAMLDRNGETLCYVGAKRDITQRKKADEDLKARARQQAVVAELGQEALAGADLSTLMQHAVERVADTLANEYCKLLELLPEGDELLLRAGVGWGPGLVGRAVEPNDLESHAGFTLRCKGPVITEDLRTETRFRAPALLRSHGVISGMDVIVQGQGRPWGVLGTHSARRRKFTQDDINFLQAIANVLAIAIERKRTEEALAQSEQRFRLAQRAANIAAYDWNLATGDVTFSEELPSLRGLCPDGKFATWLERLHREDRARLLAEVKSAAGREFDVQFRIRGNEGETLWLTSRGQVIRERGVPTHVLGILIDITARKNAEELLQRSEKLAMIGRLAASIAHEINNPLEAVTNLLYLIERHPSLGPQARDFAALAQRELNRVCHISRQTLGFYRESAIPVSVNLAEMMDDILKLYGHKIERNAIKIIKRYKLRRNAVLYSGEIRQVVSNLLLNALEAVGRGGTVIVGLEEGVDWRRPDRRGVRVVIADNGHGIRREHRSRIFEAFFTSKGEKGTGLGLWVSSGIVQKHGGSIRLRSSTLPERHGTIFTVFIPEIVAAAVSADHATSPAEAA